MASAIFGVSPGVYHREIDLSTYTRILAGTIFGVVGTFTKGPLDTVTDVSTVPQLNDIFGLATDPALANTSPSYHACKEYLRHGNRLKVVRVAGAALAKATGTISAGTGTVDFTALEDGTYGNNIKIFVTAGSTAGKKISVEWFEVEVEVFDNVSADDSLPANTTPIDTAINGVSAFLTVVNSAQTATEMSEGTITMTGGDNGISNVADSDYIGTVISGVRTGLELLAPAEDHDINALAVPGVQGAVNAVVNKGISIVEARRDSMYIVDPPDNLIVSGDNGVLAYHNGTGATYGSYSALNASYAALYWSWLQVQDEKFNTQVWIPPSGSMAGVWAYNDSVAHPWFAPAGHRRGRLRGALQLRFNPTFEDRELLYADGQSVNPLVNFTGQGTFAYGQKTTQRAATALDRINVRRMLITVQKVMSTNLQTLLFEPNDKSTRREAESLVRPHIAFVMQKRGIREYEIRFDESTNPDNFVENNILGGKVWIKPTKSAERIVVDTFITPQGVKFEENLFLS